MLTKPERLRAAFEREKVDRPPIAAWGHTFVEEWFPERLADAAVAQQAEFDWDFVKLQNRATAFAEALGGTFKPDPSGMDHPVELQPLVREARDLADVIDRARESALADELEEQLELVRLVRARLAADTPIIQSVFSPVSVLGYLVGGDVLGGNRARALELVRGGGQLVTEALDAISDMLARFVEASLAAGADGVYYAVIGYASDTHTTVEEYAERFLEHDRTVLAAASAGWANVLHLCGDRIHLEPMSALPHAALSWSVHDEGNPTIAEAAAVTPAAVATGMHRYHPIRDGSADEVAREAVEVLADAPERGFILAPGCSVSPWPTASTANLHAFRRAVR